MEYLNQRGNVNIPNASRIWLGQTLSSVHSPVFYNVAASSGLVYSVDAIINNPRFRSLEEVKKHLFQSGVAHDRCVVILARHPQAAHNRAGQLAGQIDIPLSDAGRNQILFLEAVLGGIAFSHLYTSPLQRCKILAERLKESLGLSAIIELPDLSEINYGTWAGKILRAEFGGDESIELTEPEGFRIFMQARHKWQVQGSETFWDVKRRVQKAINQVVRENWGQVVLLSTHGWVNNVICANAFGIHLAHLMDFPLVPSTGLTVIEYSASQTDNHLWLWGNADHLSKEEREVKGYG